MSSSFRLHAHAWMFVLLVAAGFLVWCDHERAQRVIAVTNTDRDEAVVDAASPTGYADGKRWLIVPEHNNRSYQWIAETQQMLARHEWRVRHVDYENAPAGRTVYSPSPYRWWLGLVAWADHAFNHHPLGLAAERAALGADPLLHLLLLVGLTLMVARQFGTFPAGLFAAGLVTLYPLAGSFLPGVPDDRNLARIFALASVLPLLLGVTGALRPKPTGIVQADAGAVAVQTQRRRHRLAAAAGIAGGLGLWVSVASEVPILLGIALGGLVATGIIARKIAASAVTPETNSIWRTWALAGAATSLVAYLVEYFPANLNLQLEVNHPLYGLAWIGVGELLGLAEHGFKPGKLFWTRHRIILLILAIGAVAALPVVMQRSETQSLLSVDPLANRLDFLPNGIVAASLPAWIARDGINRVVVATGLPVLLIVPVFGLFFRRKTEPGQKAVLALALGPVLVTLGLACRQLAWWAAFDGMLLVLGVAVSAIFCAGFDRAGVRWLWAGLVAALFLPGLIQLLPPSGSGANLEFTRLEVEGLLERNLAHWISDHAGPGKAVVLLPPDRTASWCFHGGLRGLGTANWENHDGLAATVRIVTATSADEALALINQRGITHLIIPSWDNDLDEFARWTLRNPQDAFIMALHHWALPVWLRPLPYTLPQVAGFEGQSVLIFEVTEESNRAAAVSRVAEYFVETQQLDLATGAGQALRNYPSDFGALVALVQMEKARGDVDGFNRAFSTLLGSLANGFDRTLAWDRRVSLAIVLALGERNDLAREQVRKALEKIDEPRLRSLTTASLFRLQLLAKAYSLEIADPGLRALAKKLLPTELRARL